MSGPGGALRSRTQGSIDRAIFGLALPSIGGLAFTMMFQIVDAWFLGRLGPAALAAASGSAFLYWAMESLAEIPTIGGRARLAHATGADDLDRARRSAGAALLLGLVLGLAALSAGLANLDRIFDFMQVDDEVRMHGRDYLGLLFAGVHGLVFLRVGEGLLQGSGDARTPMLAHVAALIANIALDPLLIFGVGPFPRLGAAGAALATVLCQGAGAMICLIVLRRRGLWQFGIGFASLREELSRILRIGLPIGGMSVAFSAVYVGLTRVVGAFGTPALAALGIGHRLESINYLVGVGFGSTAGALVGQNLGARQIERAGRTAMRCVLWASCVVFAFAGVMVSAPSTLARFFVDDPDTVALAATYIRAAGIVHVPMTWWIVLQGAFGGAGRTFLAMAIVLPAVLARLPLSVWLSADPRWGVDAVWWTICVTAALNGTLMLALWFRGDWKGVV